MSLPSTTLWSYGSGAVPAGVIVLPLSSLHSITSCETVPTNELAVSVYPLISWLWACGSCTTCTPVLVQGRGKCSQGGSYDNNLFTSIVLSLELSATKTLLTRRRVESCTSYSYFLLTHSHKSWYVLCCVRCFSSPVDALTTTHCTQKTHNSRKSVIFS